MLSNEKKFRRCEDGKIFTSAMQTEFWVPLRAEDGETDLVKWFSDQEFISNNKGFTYTPLGWTV